MDIIGWLRTWFSPPLKGGPGWVFCLLLCLPMTSCEFFELDEVGAETATKMSLEQDTLFVMVGDTFSLNPVFTPDTVNINDLYFLPADSGVLAVRGVDKLEAVGEGGTKLYITSVSARLLDSCMVYVVPRWEVEKRLWPYETVFYANVTFGGASLSEDMLVAAFVGNECRGLGQKMEYAGIPYYRFRVGSDQLYDENEEWDDYEEEGEYDADDIDDDGYLPRINFRCYDRSHRMLYTTSTYSVFDGEAHGSLSDLFEIKF